MHIFSKSFVSVLGALLVLACLAQAYYPVDSSIFKPRPRHYRVSRRASTPIQYNGGAVMTNPVNVYLIFYGNHSVTTQSVIENFIEGIANTSWWGVVQSYYDANGVNVSSSISLYNIWFDDYSQGTNITRADQVVTNAITTNEAIEDADGIYVILLASNVIEGQFCSEYCGYHSNLTFNNNSIKYAVIGDPSICVLNGGLPCMQAPYQKGEPTINGDQIGDGMTSIIAHEIAETVSDPEPFTAWANAVGNKIEENADKCMGEFGPYSYNEENVPYNVEFSTGMFLIPSIWSASTQSCAL